MTQDPLIQDIHSKLGLEEKGIGVEEFSRDLLASPELQNTVFNELNIASMGITPEEFSNDITTIITESFDQGPSLLFSPRTSQEVKNHLTGEELQRIYHTNGYKDDNSKEQEDITVARGAGNEYLIKYPDGTKARFYDAENASGGEKFMRFLTNRIPGIGAKGVIDVAGQLWGAAEDIYEFATAADPMGWDKYHDNAVREFAEEFEAKASVAALESPAYKELQKEAEKAGNFYEGMNSFVKKLGHVEFWEGELGEGIESMASFLIPGLALGSTLSKLNTVKNLAKYTKLSKAGAQNITKLFIADQYMSSLEAGMEAREVFTQAKEKFLQEGLSENDARRRAAEFANEAWRLNYATLMVSNGLELAFMGGGFTPFTKSIKKGLLQFGGAGLSEATQEGIQYGIQERASRFQKEDFDYEQDKAEREEQGWVKTFFEGGKESLITTWEALGSGNPEAISSLGIGFLMGGAGGTGGAIKGAYRWHKYGKKLKEKIESSPIKSPDDLYKKDEKGEFIIENGKRVLDTDKILSHEADLLNKTHTANTINLFSNAGETDKASVMYDHLVAQVVHGAKLSGMSDEEVSDVYKNIGNKESYDATGNNIQSWEDFKKVRDTAVDSALESFSSIALESTFSENSPMFKQSLIYNTAQQESVNRLINKHENIIFDIGDDPKTSLQKAKKEGSEKAVVQLKEYQEYLRNSFDKIMENREEDRVGYKGEQTKTKIEAKKAAGKNEDQIVEETKNEVGATTEEVLAEQKELEEQERINRRQEVISSLKQAQTEEDFNEIRNTFADIPNIETLVNSRRGEILKAQKKRAGELPTEDIDLMERYGEGNKLLAEEEERAIDNHIRRNKIKVNLDLTTLFEEKINSSPEYRAAALDYFKNISSSNPKNTNEQTSREEEEARKGNQVKKDVFTKDYPKKKTTDEIIQETDESNVAEAAANNATSLSVSDIPAIHGKYIKPFSVDRFSFAPGLRGETQAMIEFRDGDNVTRGLVPSELYRTIFDDRKIDRNQRVKKLAEVAGVNYTPKMTARAISWDVGPQYASVEEQEYGQNVLKTIAGKETDIYYYEIDPNSPFHQTGKEVTEDNVQIQVVAYVDEQAGKIVPRGTENSVRAVVGQVPSNSWVETPGNRRYAEGVPRYLRKIMFHYYDGVNKVEGFSAAPSGLFHLLDIYINDITKAGRSSLAKRDVTYEELKDFPLNMVVAEYGNDKNVFFSNKQLKDLFVPFEEEDKSRGKKKKIYPSDKGKVVTIIKGRLQRFDTKTLRDVPALVQKLRDALNAIKEDPSVQKQKWTEIVGYGTEYGIVSYRTSLSSFEKFDNVAGRGPILTYTSEEGFVMDVDGEIIEDLDTEDVIDNLLDRRIHIDKNKITNDEYQKNFLSQVLETDLAPPTPIQIGEKTHLSYSHSPSLELQHPISIEEALSEVKVISTNNVEIDQNPAPQEVVKEAEEDLQKKQENTANLSPAEKRRQQILAKRKEKEKATTDKTEQQKEEVEEVKEVEEVEEVKEEDRRKREEEYKKEKARYDKWIEENNALIKETVQKYFPSWFIAEGKVKHESFEPADKEVSESFKILTDLYFKYIKEGQAPFAAFYKATVILGSNASPKHIKHEAFHYHFNIWLSDKQRAEILADARKTYKLDDAITDRQVEERLADEFEDYKNDIEIYHEVLYNISPTISNFFQKLFNYIFKKSKRLGYEIRSLWTNKQTVQNFFYEIESGVVLKGYEKGSLRNLIVRINEAKWKESEDALFKQVWDTSTTIRYAEFINREVLDTFLAVNYPIIGKTGKEEFSFNLSKIAEHYDLQKVLQDWSKNIVQYFDEYTELEGLNSPKIQEIREVLTSKTSAGENFREVLKRNLSAVRGVNVKNLSFTPLTQYEEDNVLEEQTELERWQLGVDKRNPVENITTRLREFFGNIKIIINGETQKHLDTGQIKYYNSTAIHNKLLDELSDSVSPEHMMQRLLDMRARKIEWVEQILQHIYTDEELLNAISDGKYVLDNLNMRKAIENDIFRDIWLGIGSARNVNYIVQREQFNGQWWINDANRGGVVSKILNNAQYIYGIKYKDRDVSSYENMASVDKDGVLDTDARRFHNWLKGLGFEVSKDVATSILMEKKVLPPIVKSINASIEKGKNPHTELKSVMSRLAKLIQKFDLSIEQRSIINVQNEKQFNHLLNNRITEIVNEIKNDPVGFATQRMSFIFHKDLPFYTQITQAAGEGKRVAQEWVKNSFKIEYTDGRKEKGAREGKQYKKFTEADIKSGNINTWYSLKAQGKDVARFVVPVFSDKTAQAYITVPNHSNLSTVVDYLLKTALAEQSRILNIQTTGSNVENYGFSYDKNGNKIAGNGEKFNLLPVFNENGFSYTTINGKIIPNETNRNILQEDLEFRYREWIESLIANRIVERTEQGIIRPTSKIDNRITEKDLKQYYYNQFYYNTVFSSVFSMDAAFYENVGDLQKRNSQTHTPGGRGLYGDETFSMLILDDVKLPSKESVINSIKKLFPAPKASWILDKFYKNNNITDAQSYHTLDRREQVLKAHNKWTPQHEKAWSRLKQGLPLPEDLELVLQPLKLFYYKEVPQGDTLVPLQIKDSQVVLLPEFAYVTKDGTVVKPDGQDFSKYVSPDLAKLLNTMEKGEIDLVTFRSAVKVGRTEVYNGDISPENVKDFVQRTIPNSGVGLIQIVPEKHEDVEVLLATQIRKLLFADIDPSFTYNGMALPELRSLFNDILKLDVAEGLAEARKITKSKETLRKYLIDKLLDRGLDQHLIKALDLVEDGNFLSPLVMPSMGKKFQGYVNSLFKNIIKVKTKGASLVNMSSYGYAEDLQLVTDPETGAIKYYEAAVPAHSKKLLKYADKNGVIDISKVPEKALMGFMYRIPTENKYSMFPIKIKRFLPASQGGSILLPRECTEVSGLDFDVDKLFGFFYELNEDGSVIKSSKNNKASRANLRLDIMLAIGQSIDFAKSHFNPGTTKRLEELVNKYGQSLKDFNTIADPLIQESLATRNMVGGRLIGQIANANAHHSLIQGQGNLKLVEPIDFNNLRTDHKKKYSNITHNNTELNRQISENLSTLLFASTEHAKNPLLDKVNINEVTGSYATTLLRLGVPLEEVVKFLTNPVMVQFANAVQSYDTLTAKEIIKNEFSKGKNSAFWRELHKLDLASEQLFRIEQASKADSGNVGPTLYDVREKLQSINQIHDNTVRTFDSKPLTLSSGWIIEGVETVLPLVDNEFQNKKPNYSISKLSDQFVEMTGIFTEVLVEEINQLTPYYNFFNEIFDDVTSRIAEYTKTGRLTTKQIERIYNELYLANIQGAIDVSLEDLWLNFPERFMTTALPDELTSFKSMFETEVNDEGVTVLNLAQISGILPQDVEKLRNDWDKLYSINYDLAENLALYSLFIKGLNFEFGSFSHLLPASFFETPVGNRVRQVINSLDNHTSHIDPTTISHKIIEANFTSFVPKIDVRKDTTLVQGKGKIHDTITLKNIRNYAGQVLPYVWTSYYINKEKGSVPVLYQRIDGAKYIKVDTPVTYNSFSNYGTTISYTTKDLPENLMTNQDIGNANPPGETKKQAEERRDQTNKNIDPLYNLSPEDKTRRARDGRLEKMVDYYLDKMGVRKMAMADYRARYGHNVDAQGVADLLNRVVALAEKPDGVTLPEEGWHFVVEMLWDSQEMTAIRNAKTADGVNALEATEMWEKEAPRYLEAYNGNKEWVQKEIIGKLLAQLTYDEYAKERLPVKLKKWFRRLLERLFGIVRKDPSINSGRIARELESLLNEEVQKFKAGELNVDVFAPGENVRQLSEINWNERSIREALRNLSTRVKVLQKQQLGLIGSITKERFLELKREYGDENIERLQQRLEELESEAGNMVQSEIEKERINEYINLIKSIDRDNANLAKVEALQKRIEKIVSEIRKRKFQGGIFMFFVGADGKGGMRGDIQDLKKDRKAILDGSLDLDLSTYRSMTQAVELYTPIVDEIKLFYDQGNTFEELSKADNKELKKKAKEFQADLSKINRFLKTQVTSTVQKEMAKYVATNSQLSAALSAHDYVFTEVSAINLALGSAMDTQEDWMGIFMKKIVDTHGVIQANVYVKGSTLYSQLKDDLDKIGLEGLKGLIEKDEKGNNTHYFISPFNTSKYEKAREEAGDKIIDELNTYAEKRGWNTVIPKDRKARHQYFAAHYLSGLTEEEQEKEAKIRERLKKMYGLKWAEWFNKNTRERSNIKQIEAKRRKELNNTQFAEWQRNNWGYVETFDNSGNVVPKKYPKGELVVPAQGGTGPGLFKGTIKKADYTNPQYKNLSEAQKNVLRAFKQEMADAKVKLGLATSFEQLQRLPQVGKSTADVIYAKGKGFQELVKGGLLSRADDDIRANTYQNEMLERPPIRFTELMETPSDITEDLFSSVMKYINMTEDYVEFGKVLPELQGMRDAVRAGQVSETGFSAAIKGKFRGAAKVLISGRESNLNKKMTHMLEVLVFGERVQGNKAPQWMRPPLGDQDQELDWDKVSNRLASYIRHLNLLGNLPSQVTGLMMGSMDNIVEASIGKYNTKEDYLNAKSILAHNLGGLISDFENPIKKNKISIAMASIALIDSPLEHFTSTEKAWAFRAIGRTLDYGGWRAADVILKSQAMITTGLGIRLINGKWKTKNRLTESEASLWEGANTLWDTMTAENGVLNLNTVTKEAYNMWRRKSLILASRLDTVPTMYDKGTWYNHVLFRFLTIHMGWLYQQTARGFKQKHFNYITEEHEEGYWVGAANAGFLNPLNWLTLMNDWHLYSPTQREAVYRILGYSASFAAAYALAYVMTAIANGDDEDDALTQHMAYLASRILLEQSARLSPTEAFDYIQRPVAGLDKVNNFGVPADVIMSFWKDEERVKSGFYKGYEPSTKRLIKSIPLLKGGFENIYGGYINEATGWGKTTTVGTAVEGKRNYVNNQVINRSTGSLMDGPVTIPLRYIAWLLAQPTARSLAPDTYKSKDPQDLPTKKANE